MENQNYILGIDDSDNKNEAVSFVSGWREIFRMIWFKLFG